MVVLLAARGLPREFILNLIEEEIKGTLIDLQDNDMGRKRAYKLVRQNTPIASRQRAIGTADAFLIFAFFFFNMFCLDGWVVDITAVKMKALFVCCSFFWLVI